MITLTVIFYALILGLIIFWTVLLVRIDARIREVYAIVVKDRKFRGRPKVDPGSLPEELDLGQCLQEDRNEKLMEEIKRMLSEDKLFLDPNFSEKKFAELLGTNVSYVSEAVNTAYGKNFKAVLNEHRIEYSIHLAEEDPRQSVAELANKCGYRTDVTFATHFKEVVGEPPSIYMKGLLAMQSLGRQLPSKDSTPLQE